MRRTLHKPAFVLGGTEPEPVLPARFEYYNSYSLLSEDKTISDKNKMVVDSKSQLPFGAPRSIIVLTREHIGDLVCTTPALRSLRALYPDAQITVEVGERAAGVLANNPRINDLMIRKDHQGALGKLKVMLELRRRKYDLGVILDNATAMPLTLWAGGVAYRVGIVRKRRFARLLNASTPFDRTIHEMVDNFRNVVALLGADTSDKSTEVFPTENDGKAVDSMLAEAGITSEDTLIALNPGASAPSNRWTPERFAQLIDMFAGYDLNSPGLKGPTKCVVLGGPSDQGFVDDIRKLARHDFIQYTGKLSIMELAVVLGRCRVVVTGDTGPMHIAVAMRSTVVCLFGPAVPSESGPGYSPGHRTIRKVESCPKCTKYLCREDHKCMRLITAEEVFEEVRGILDVGLIEEEMSEGGSVDPTEADCALENEVESVSDG